MRIGIITIPPYANYGGLLQAYALCHVLQGMGHEVEVVYRSDSGKHRQWLMPLVYVKRAILKYVFGRRICVFHEKRMSREWPVIIQNTIGFVEKHIPYRDYGKYSNIRQGDYDAFVVGSDQIWRPCFAWGDIEDAFLRFAEGWDVRRIAYAASFGVDHWEYTGKQTEVCARLARQFDAITVRESSGVDLCRKYLGVDATHVLDPTMLLDPTDYEALIGDDSTPHKGEILTYVLDWNEGKRQILERLEQLTGKRSFRANSRYEEGFEAPLEERIQPSVESWLQGFRDAAMVVTDSFHACAFSIIFNKPFYVVGNKNRGLARIHSLLAMFGLEDRLVETAGETYPSAPIDWEKVNARREALKEKAGKVLEKLQ